MKTRYTQVKIGNTVRALATLFNVDSAELKVTHGAACVMQGIVNSTEDIDIQVSNPEVWNAFESHHPAVDTPCGPRITLPGIEIHLEEHMATPCEYQRISGIVVATLESLDTLYRYMVNNPNGRSLEKQDQDVQRLTIIEGMIKHHNEKANNQNVRQLKALGALILGLARFKDLVYLAHTIGSKPLEVVYKDDHHRRWKLTLNETELTITPVDMLDIAGYTMRYKIKDLEELM